MLVGLPKVVQSAILCLCVKIKLRKNVPLCIRKYGLNNNMRNLFKQKKKQLDNASDGKVECTPCHEVNNLGVRASRGVNISTQWADSNITFYGSTRTVQLSSEKDL